MSNVPRKWVLRVRRLMVVLVFACALLTFGISGRDEAAFRTFTADVADWQANPEFRVIAMDYSVRGSAALRTRPFWVPAKRIIIACRSVPGLPKQYAVSPTSRLHYENFSKGPLSGYLHLCSEQNLPDIIGIMEAAARKPSRSDADMNQVLNAFKMDFAVAHDDGARQSVADLLNDIDGSRPLTVRSNIRDLLGDPIHQIAVELHLPEDVSQLTPQQQQSVLDRLDPYIRVHNPELWRTKQVSDFCGGVWAQVFGPPYDDLISPILRAREVSGVLLVVLLMILLVTRAPRKNESADHVADSQAEIGNDPVQT